MKARIWGCRGSLATPGPETVRAGGNTSCVEVRLADDTVVVLDAGTGIRVLGRALADEGIPTEIHLLLTHLHLDHIEGLGFFAPIWSPETKLHVWGPRSPIRTLRESVARCLSPPLFPRDLGDIPANVVFHDAPPRPWQLGAATVFALPVEHPGPTVGYRIELDGRALAYIPDHEPALAADLTSASPDWISGFALAKDVDILVHDAQYSEEEYPLRVGWGHSSVADAVAFARRAEARELVLFHHDPSHSDGDLEVLAGRARELAGGNGWVRLACEGSELPL
jgi:phosphoribosyl 1,2-cyclic phosphodiesterase